jgi:L-fuconolactonase
LADAFPNTQFIINHVGQAVVMHLPAHERPAVFQELREALRELGRRPNITCKIGGMGLPFWGFGFENRADPIGYLELAAAWKPLVEMAIEAFGADRCMMESNFPPDGRAAGFVPLWNALKTHCA